MHKLTDEFAVALFEKYPTERVRKSDESTLVSIVHTCIMLSTTSRGKFVFCAHYDYYWFLFVQSLRMNTQFKILLITCVPIHVNMNHFQCVNS